MTLAVAERDGAIRLMKSNKQRVPVARWGRIQAYDTREFVAECRELGLTPQSEERPGGSALDARTTRHTGYRLSQRIGKRTSVRATAAQDAGTRLSQPRLSQSDKGGEALARGFQVCLTLSAAHSSAANKSPPSARSRGERQ